MTFNEARLRFALHNVKVKSYLWTGTDLTLVLVGGYDDIIASIQDQRVTYFGDIHLGLFRTAVKVTILL